MYSVGILVTQAILEDNIIINHDEEPNHTYDCKVDLSSPNELTNLWHNTKSFC